MHDNTNSHLGTKHLFLTWLIVPLLLAWLFTNYILGTITNRPLWSKENGIQENEVVSYAAQYPKIQKASKGLLTLWFDDAWLSQYMVAKPIMDEFEFKGAIAVPTGLVGGESYTNWPQLRALQYDEWEIVNHSTHHDCNMATWPRERIAEELDMASQTLWKNRLSSEHFVSPCGVQSDALVVEVKKRFLSFRGIEPGYNDLENLNTFFLKVQNITNHTKTEEIRKWIEYAKAQDVWLILVFHQIGETLEVESDKGESYAVTTQQFKEIMRSIADSGIQVALPSQILTLTRIEA